MRKITIPKKNLIFIVVLIIALAIFGFSIKYLSAEDSGETPTETAETTETTEATETVVEPTIEPPADEVIITGDAEVVIEGENTVNSNIVDPPLETPLEESLEEPLEEPLEEFLEEPECTENCEVEEIVSESAEVVFDNEAELENNVEAGGFTGDNEIETEGDAVIVTGNVNIYVGLINTVNSNIINSKLSEILYNIFNNAQGDINIPDEVVSSPEGCGETECHNIVADNEGSIDNNVLVDGSSGNNSVETKGGDAIIATGDVNVVTNIFNVLNSNIIGSNWVRLIINIFGNWTGDLVLPGQQAMQNFMENSSSMCGAGCEEENIVSNNDAEIENNVQVNANTGDNSASGDDSTIITGNANAQTDVLNVANSNITHNNWFFMAINNFGNWQGSIFSLPEGFNLSQDLKGVKIFNSGPNGEDGGTASGSNSLNLVKDNSGSINNGVIINIDTGNNSAESEDGSAYIQTGDANAITDVINVLNSNVTGSNWLLGMINVFGSWQGNVAFGRPDLWIGESAESRSNPVEIDQTITYTLTYYNQGDAAATGVVLTDDFDERYVWVKDPGSGVVIDNPGEIQWDLGRIMPGESGSVTYIAGVNSNVPFGITKAENQATIDTFEDDANNQDNTEEFSINIIRRSSDPNPILIYPEVPRLEIVKSVSDADGIVYQGELIEYALEITNNSDSQAYRVVVTDILTDGLPGPLSTNTWNLDYVFPNEKIVINYSVYIGPEVPPGLYTNTAQANGFYIWGDPISSNEASVTIEVKAMENTGIVEGAASTSEEFEEPAFVPTDVASAGEVGIGEEIAAVVEQETEEPEVLGAKTSDSRRKFLSAYPQIQFEDWIFILLLLILGSAAVGFTTLYFIDLRKGSRSSF